MKKTKRTFAFGGLLLGGALLLSGCFPPPEGTVTGKEYEADESCWEIELDTGYELCLSKEEFKTYDIGDYYPKGE